MTKLDFTKPEELQTRDGRQVRIYATDGKGPYVVHGAVRYEECWVAYKWNINGRGINDYQEDIRDLTRKPARIKGWVNVYDSCYTEARHCVGSTVFTSKEEALHAAGHAGDGICLGQIYIDAEVQL